MFHEHRPALWRYLRVLGCDAATADDLVQEVFVVVMRRRDFDASMSPAVFAFLRTTARHLYLKWRRVPTALRDVEEADRVWDMRCPDHGAARLAALRACLDGLPRRSRALLEATYGQRQGRDATARAFGIGPSGVKSALRRVRACLHDCIHKRLKEDE